MMTAQTAKGTAATENGAKYVQQLVKHWSHKPGTTFDESMGKLAFANGNTITFTAQATQLDVVAGIGKGEDLAHSKGVIDAHLQRFAFREDFVLVWDDQPT